MDGSSVEADDENSVEDPHLSFTKTEMDLGTNEDSSHSNHEVLLTVSNGKDLNSDSNHTSNVDENSDHVYKAGSFINYSGSQMEIQTDYGMKTLNMCLKESENVRIDLLAKKNVRLKLIVEEIKDVYSNDEDESEFGENNDLVNCCVKKSSETLYSERDCSMYVSFEQNKFNNRVKDEAKLSHTLDDDNGRTFVISRNDSDIDLSSENVTNKNQRKKQMQTEDEECEVCGKIFQDKIRLRNQQNVQENYDNENESVVPDAGEVQLETIKQEETPYSDAEKFGDVKSQKRERIEGLVESLRSQKMSSVGEITDNKIDKSARESRKKLSKSDIKKKQSLKCHICGKNFLYSKPFQKHMEIHKLFLSRSSVQEIVKQGSTSAEANPITKCMRDEINTTLTENEVSGSKRKVNCAKYVHKDSGPSNYKSEMSSDEVEQYDTEDSAEEIDDSCKDPDFTTGNRTTKCKKTSYKVKQSSNDEQSMPTCKKTVLENDRDTSKGSGASSDKKEVVTDVSVEVKLHVKKRGRPSKKSEDILSMPEKEDGLYRCGICGKTFTQNNCRKEHMNTHKGVRPFKCKMCPKSYFWSGNLRGHIRRVHRTERPYRCNICGGGYTEQNQLNKHMLIHGDNKPFECQDCGRKFIQASALRNHSVVHTGLKLHSCSVCGKKFSLPSYVKEHMKVHLNVRNYTCDICGKQYIRGEHLKIHKKAVHSVERPFSCKECGKCFPIRFRLRLHMLTHTKPVICEICGKSFTSTSGLNSHMPMHTGAKPFECEFCGKKFRWRGGYKKHRLLHIGHKQFSCGLCGKGFNIKKTYLDHLNTHTGEKPYQCKLCSSKFGHYSCLRRHYKNLHPSNKQNVKDISENIKMERSNNYLPIGNVNLDTYGIYYND